MKLIKSNLASVIALGALMACGSINAQPTPPAAPAAPGAASPGHLDRNGLEQMIDKLGVTAETKEKLLTTFKEQAQKRMALRGDSSLSPEDRQAKVKTLMAETKSKIDALLTPEQQAKWEALVKEGREHMKNAGTAPAKTN